MDQYCHHKLEKLLNKIQRCQVCAAHLPLGPHPVLQVSTTASLLIVGQAPGIKAHNAGMPFNDRSGDRLRTWLNISKETFYDVSRIAIMPMGFCYPGLDKHGGDKPPRKECAPLWHASISTLMPNIRLTLLVGSYAQKYYLKEKQKKSMTETVAAWQEYLPTFIPLPHPSWRNTGWLKNNIWFTTRLIPALRNHASNILKNDCPQ